MHSLYSSSEGVTFVLFAMLVLLCIKQSKNYDFAEAGFWVPRIPPRAHYLIDCQIVPSKNLIEISEKILFKNSTPKNIHWLLFNWPNDPAMPFELSVNGKVISLGPNHAKNDNKTPIICYLPEPILPNGEVEFVINCIHKGDISRALEIRVNDTKNLDCAIKERNPIPLTHWYPQIWWGFDNHNDFDVRVQIPSNYVVSTSGSFIAATGFYRAKNVRSFGLIIGKDLDKIEERTDDVLIRAFFKNESEGTARLISETAVDVVGFYKRYFGFYPYPFLTIIPGSDDLAGGYPVATNIVAIHGQGAMFKVPPFHWERITAHEIAHQYWGEHILEKDAKDLSWLMIGLGIYTDREYILTRGLGNSKHIGFMSTYLGAVQKKLDTRADRYSDYINLLHFNFNSFVIHAKGFSIISALACLLGYETFKRILVRCLKEYAGRGLGTYDFRLICEEETSEELGWFFDQWVRSNRFLSYEIVYQNCIKRNGQYSSEVWVNRKGDLKMPIPVRAYFKDNTYKDKFTNGILKTCILKFESKSPLKKVELDPNRELAMISATPHDIHRTYPKNKP